jgi:hypothetical protein
MSLWRPRYCLLFAAVYALAPLAQQAHELVEHAGETCEDCEQGAAGDPCLEADCDPAAACEEPDHHHHEHGPRHHADECLVCQLGLSMKAILPSSADATLAFALRSRVLPPLAQAPLRERCEIPLARGPPPLS